MPDHDPFTTAQRRSLPSIGALPKGWDASPMTRENHRAVLLARTTHLPFFFGLFLGDAEVAIGMVRGDGFLAAGMAPDQ